MTETKKPCSKLQKIIKLKTRTGRKRMKRAVYILSFLMFFAFLAPVFAADFKPYPGLKIDTKATKEATELLKQSGMTGKATIYTTSDHFEKVYAFYKGISKEYKMPGEEGGKKKLPSGQELREAYFIFDGAADIMVSKLWIKIQRPYIGSVEMGKDFQVKYKDVRDVTAVTVSEGK
jgi:hypothetical protein